MKAYKLIRKMKDGSLSPLFINQKSRIPIGVWMDAELHPKKGFAVRKGWHCTLEPKAPHLSEKDRVWVVVHSGSRGLGYKTATEYTQWGCGVGLGVDSPIGRDYIIDMNFCLAFALESRERMAYKVHNILCDILGVDYCIPVDTLINRNINMAGFRSAGSFLTQYFLSIQKNPELSCRVLLF